MAFSDCPALLALRRISERGFEDRLALQLRQGSRSSDLRHRPLSRRPGCFCLFVSRVLQSHVVWTEAQ